MDDRRNFNLVSTIVWVAIAQLFEANRKTRRHALSKIKKLAASIAETGYFNPILVTEKFEIIAGHARLDAAKRLGMTQVPVLILPGLSEAQKKALRLADNKLAEDAKWDEDLVILELGELVDLGHPLEFTGFDTIEVDRLLTPRPLALGDDDEELPEPPETTVTRAGDHWQCGDHLLGCGDARDDSFYDQLLWGQKADMVFTDAPYNLPTRAFSGLGKAKHDNFAVGAGEMTATEFSDFLVAVMTLCKTHTRDGSVHFQCIDFRHVAEMVTAGREVFGTLLNIAIWVKNNAGMGSFYRSQHEMVVVLKNGTAPHINNIHLGRMGRYRSNCWFYPGGSSFSKSRDADLAAHPSVKNLSMVADAIRDVTVPGQLVLDPFGGSGTTMIAAQSVGRRAVLIEIDPKYVDVALLRFQRATGVEPVLLPNRTPMSVVASQRGQVQHG